MLRKIQVTPDQVVQYSKFRPYHYFQHTYIPFYPTYGILPL